MEDLQTELQEEFVQERNSGARKGFFYDRELGGYVPAKGKKRETAQRQDNVKLIILIAVTAVAVLAYIFRNKLKTLWLQKAKEVLSS